MAQQVDESRPGCGSSRGDAQPRRAIRALLKLVFAVARCPRRNTPGSSELKDALVVGPMHRVLVPAALAAVVLAVAAPGRAAELPCAKALPLAASAASLQPCAATPPPCSPAERPCAE
jgi:hypothetical protein